MYHNQARPLARNLEIAVATASTLPQITAVVSAFSVSLGTTYPRIVFNSPRTRSF